jgi:hypothetical protein
LTQSAGSCYCVPSAEGSLRVPDYRWPESRAA